MLSGDDADERRKNALIGAEADQANSGRKVAFLFPGQGSQYVNMLDQLRATEPIVAETFAEADAVMTPLLDASGAVVGMASAIFGSAVYGVAAPRQSLVEAGVRELLLVSQDTSVPS